MQKNAKVLWNYLYLFISLLFLYSGCSLETTTYSFTICPALRIYIIASGFCLCLFCSLLTGRGERVLEKQIMLGQADVI